MVRVGDLTIQDQAVTLPIVFKGVFFRTMTDPSGTQAITGVGFKPKFVLFQANTNGGNAFSIGQDNGSFRGSTYANDGNIATGMAGTTSSSLNIHTGVSIYQRGLISSLDIDGFTITWTKLGSPTLTGEIHFSAFK